MPDALLAEPGTAWKQLDPLTASVAAASRCVAAATGDSRVLQREPVALKPATVAPAMAAGPTVVAGSIVLPPLAAAKGSARNAVALSP